jgi:four helix bundle protein
MDSIELKRSTKQFVIDIIRFADPLPSDTATTVIKKQLIRAATSVGANYRAACRARSKADFISKITIVEEEADECQYWLELFAEIKNSYTDQIRPLLDEAGELTAIFTSTGKTAKHKS